MQHIHSLLLCPHFVISSGPLPRASKMSRDLPVAFLMLEIVKRPTHPGCLSAFSIVEDNVTAGDVD